MKNFLDIALTDANLEVQEAKGSVGLYDTSAPGADALSPHEIDHVVSSNSFYMATVNEDGWPYVQHRGGDRGFVKILGPTTIGWVERNGNRQYVGTGNIAANGRVSLIFVDYLNRTRLKLLGTARHYQTIPDELTDRINPEGHRADGAIVIDIEATAWNCPKFITPRIEVETVRPAIEELQARVAELEAELEAVRATS